MTVCAMDHQRTRWLVLSLVMRNRSSRNCKGNKAVSHAWPDSSCHASFNCCPPPDPGLVEMPDRSSFAFQSSSTTLPTSPHAARKPASLPTVKCRGLFSCTSVYNSLKGYTATSSSWLKANTACKSFGIIMLWSLFVVVCKSDPSSASLAVPGPKHLFFQCHPQDV